MAKKTYILYVSVKDGKNPSGQIESRLAGMGWARLRGGEVYLIYAEQTPREVRDLIQPLLGDSGHIFVSELNTTNHSGFLAKSTVDWLQGNRE